MLRPQHAAQRVGDLYGINPVPIDKKTRAGSCLRLSFHHFRRSSKPQQPNPSTGEGKTKAPHGHGLTAADGRGRRTPLAPLRPFQTPSDSFGPPQAPSDPFSPPQPLPNPLTPLHPPQPPGPLPGRRRAGTAALREGRGRDKARASGGMPRL